MWDLDETELDDDQLRDAYRDSIFNMLGIEIELECDGSTVNCTMTFPSPAAYAERIEMIKEAASEQTTIN